jgi:hypothetical protein
VIADQRSTKHSNISSTALLADLLFITVLCSVTCLVVNPIGNFPLNDDWVYGRAVEQLLRAGDYRPLDLATPTLLSNVLWGALFCLPGGFSFTALRLSTLVAALLGVIGSYILVRDLNQPRWLALSISLVLAFNPIYYALSHTFMTDVPFIAVAVWSAVFLSRSLRSGSEAQMLIGTLLALVATLSRNLAMFLPLAFALTMMLKSKLTLRVVVRAVFPLFLCSGFFFGFEHWLKVSGRLPALSDYQVKLLLHGLADPRRFLPQLFINYYFALVYLGFFLFPILLLRLRDLMFIRNGRAWSLMSIGIAAMAAGATLQVTGFSLQANGLALPSEVPGNILVKSGIGPITLRDTFELNLDHMSALPDGLWIVATGMALTGAVLLIAKLSLLVSAHFPKIIYRNLSSNDDAVGVFLILCAIIYLTAVIAAGFYDRYLIPCLPFIATGIIALSGKCLNVPPGEFKYTRHIAFAVVGVFGLFAVGATRDYLTWNRIRWLALQHLILNDGVHASDIDGGYEFNGYYLYNVHYKESPGRSAWWVAGDTYQIGFGGVPGYTVFRNYTYQNWLLPRRQAVVVLRRE